MARFILSELAIDDLAAIRNYVAADNPAAADRLMAGFFQRFQMIGDQPLIGTAKPEYAGGDLRIHSVGNYAIVYRIVAAEVEIARVLHGARDYGSLLA